MARSISDKVKKTIAEFARLRSESRNLKTMSDDMQPGIIEAIDGTGNKSVSFEYEDGRYTATVVRGSSFNVDEDRLKKAVGAKAWAKVTKRTLDADKLDAAIASGLVDANVVAQCTEEKQNRPYVKVTEKRA